MTTRTVLAAVLAATSIAAPPAQAAATAPTITPVAHYVNRFRITAAVDVVVGARSRISTADVRLARGTDRPERIAGIASLPTWAVPHLGTDKDGGAVLVYPRCAKHAVSSCNLYAWDLTDERERALAEANTPGVGETEGVLDHGSLAFSRWTSARDPIDVLQDQNEATALFYAPVGGAARRLGSGGQQLALSGDWIAQIRDTRGPHGSGSSRYCGDSTVELVSVAGEGRFAVRSMPCGSIKTFQSPTFVGDALIFGATGSDRHPNGLIYRYDRLAGRTFAAPGPSRFDQFVATSLTGGYGVWQQDQGQGGSDVIKVDGLTFDREVATPRSASHVEGVRERRASGRPRRTS